MSSVEMAHRPLPSIRSKAETTGAVLVADLGGTNVRFGVAMPHQAQPLLIDTIRRYRVAQFSSPALAAQHYLKEIGTSVTSAVLAVAGLVENGHVQITNSPWVVSEAALREGLGLSSVRLVNDFAALSLGVSMLREQDVQMLGSAPPQWPGSAANQTFAVLGPGTGLGVGALLMRDGKASVLETEAGHISFAPGTHEETAILNRLLTRFERVSYERLLCGSGLVNLHRALCEMREAPFVSLSAESISAHAARGDDAMCVRAIEIFCEMLGNIAGDLVLAYGAWNGVYLAGGLLEPLLPQLRAGGFRRRFEAKGRFSQRLQSVPIAAITHPQPGLLGAAALAVADAEPHSTVPLSSI